MKAHPILFSAEMIRALLDGRKVQTRRALKTQPLDILPMEGDKAGREWIILEQREPEPKGKVIRCRYGVPSDLLIVRETFAHVADYDGTDPGSAALASRCFYRADHPTGVWSERDPNKSIRWRPSIHMPRALSRLTLRITNIRVERLQEISEADARAEGVHIDALSPASRERFSRMKPWPECYRPMYALLWDDINGAGSWSRNDWVWVIAFEVIQANIDQVMKREAA